MGLDALGENRTMRDGSRRRLVDNQNLVSLVGKVMAEKVGQGRLGQSGMGL